MPDAGPRAFSVVAANLGNIDVTQCDGALYEPCNAAQEARVIGGIARVRPDIALLSETITQPILPAAFGPQRCKARVRP